MTQFAKHLSAVACVVLAAMLCALPAGAQAYGNNGTTGAGPGTGASVQVNGRSPSDRGGWGIWGLVGLLGLFGMGMRRGAMNRTSTTIREPLPRSGSSTATPTITETATGREKARPDVR